MSQDPRQNKSITLHELVSLPFQHYENSFILLSWDVSGGREQLLTQMETERWPWTNLVKTMSLVHYYF